MATPLQKDLTRCADSGRAPIASYEGRIMDSPTPHRQHRRRRPWALLAASAGFLSAVTVVFAIGVVSLHLTPVLQ